MGGGNIKHWSKTQPTIPLSGGQAELNGIMSGIAQALGILSICLRLGIYLQVMRAHRRNGSHRQSLQAMDGKTKPAPWDRLRNEHGGLSVQSRNCFRVRFSLHSLIAGSDSQTHLDWMIQIDDSSSSIIVRPQSRRTRPEQRHQ